MTQTLGYHLDLKRAMPTREYLDDFFDRLAAIGYNAVLLEIEDKYRFAKHPAIAHLAAWTPPRMVDFCAALRDRGFDVIPLVQSFGHGEYVLSKPEYEHLRIDVAASLLQRLRELRAASRELFARTYDPASIEEELDLRYGFHAAWLERAAG